MNIKEEPTVPEVEASQRYHNPEINLKTEVKEEPMTHNDEHSTKSATPELKREMAAPSVPLENQTIRHVCIVCREIFDSKSHLDKHVLSHTLASTPFRCYKCGSVFSQKSDLMQHWRNCFFLDL